MAAAVPRASSGSPTAAVIHSALDRRRRQGPSPSRQTAQRLRTWHAPRKKSSARTDSTRTLALAPGNDTETTTLGRKLHASRHLIPVILLIALVQMGQLITVRQTLGFIVALSTGAVIVYSFWLILATLAFWFIKIENILVIFDSMYQAGRWPIGIYPPALRITLTFLVPVAFAVTVPAEAAVGRLTGATLLGAIGLAIALFALSRWFWNVGIQHYAGASA